MIVIYFIVAVVLLTLLYKYRNIIKLIYKLYFKKETPDTLIIKDNYVIVKCTRSGINYEIRLPYNKSQRYKNYKMVLIKDNDTEDVSHPPGVNYYLSAEMLGGNMIIKQEHGENVATFDKDEIPN